MRIRIESNFVIPGFQDQELQVKERTTLRQLLGSIARCSEERIEFFRSGSDQLDAEDWEVELNGAPHHDDPAQLDTPLADGDLVAVRIRIIGGG